LAVGAANGTLDGPGRQAMATQVAQLQERLVDLGNTQGASGQFIFAGQESDTKPFAWNPPNLTFNGDDLAVTIEAKPGEAMVVNVPTAPETIDRLMTTLEDFRQALLGGDTSLIGERDLKAIQAGLEEIGLVRAGVGTRLQSVEALHDRNVQRMDELTRQVSDAHDIDLAKAMTDLKSAETAYQAALQVASQGFQFSLMDFLR
jgi:flagellar hook-associated protein 3 FlgL